MARTIATTSLAFVVLAAFAMLAGARADHSSPRAMFIFCEETLPFDSMGSSGLGGIRKRDDIIGGERTTGPTFPSFCSQGAAMHPIGDAWPPQKRGCANKVAACNDAV